MLYKDWLNIWIKDYVKSFVKNRTYKRYSEIVSQHIIPHLGDYKLKRLTPILVQNFINFLIQFGNKKTGKGLSPNSVNLIITIIQSSLKIAYKIGVIKLYNADKIKRPNIVEKEVTCFSISEQKKIEKAIMCSKKTKLLGIILCLYLGLRIGEMLALEWEDINFYKYEIKINKTCYDGKDINGKYCRITDSPKTKSSNRVIPIPKQILPILKELKTKSLSKNVISDGKKTISIRAYQKSFSCLLDKLKITKRGFHSLRHTFATRAIECGMDVKTLSEILGHKSSSITINRYTHSLMSHKKEMINKLGKIFIN